MLSLGNTAAMARATALGGGRRGVVGRKGDGVRGAMNRGKFSLKITSAASSSSSPSSAAAAELKSELLDILGKGGDGAARMARVGDRGRLEQLVTALEECNPNPKPFEVPELLLNEWQLLTTFAPGTADVQFLDPESWRKYIFEQGGGLYKFNPVYSYGHP